MDTLEPSHRHAGGGAPRRSAAEGGVQLDGVAKSYGEVTALRGVSLDILPGQFVALLGPSGCGKTTLLGLVAGFADPDRGAIRLNGEAVGPEVPPHMRNVGVVFQSYALFPHLTVAQNIAFPLEVRDVPAAEIGPRVARAVAMVALTGLEGRMPAELSGGQQQRVALARALVYAPPVLLLDEPLGALDRRLRDAMQAELKSLHKDLGTTFIYVTHDQEEALAMADTVVVMRHGLVVQVGAAGDVYARPRTRFVATFVGECNLIAGERRRDGAGVVVVDRASGAVLYRGGGELAPGGATVAVRPEWIALADREDQCAPGSSIVPGRIVQQRFRGCETLVDLDTPFGRMMVRVPDWLRAGVDLATPAKLLHWRPERAVVVADDEPAADAAHASTEAQEEA